MSVKTSEEPTRLAPPTTTKRPLTPIPSETFHTPAATAAGTPQPSPRPASAPLPPDVERLHGVWADLRSTLAVDPPSTSGEFAERANKLWNVIVQGLEGIAEAKPDEDLKAVMRENKGRQRVVRSAQFAVTSADIEAQSKAFAESVERIRSLADPKVLERGQ